MAGNYFAQLPAYQPNENALNFAPINNALDGITQQQNQNRQFGMQQQQIDQRQAEQTYQHGRDAKQDGMQQVQLFGKQATAVDQLQGPQRAAAWSSILAKHGTKDLTPEELDPATGPKLMAAQAGQFVDPLDRETKQAGLELTRAQTNAANRKADPYEIKEVNGTLVRVPKSGGEAEVVYRSGPDQTKAPQGYRFAHDGQTLVPIPGGPGDKLTEGESKDALFAERLIRSNASVDKLMNIDEKGNIRGYDPTKNTNSYVPDSGLIANVVNSDSWKNYQQAAREGLASILRKDTGAAVTPEEFKLYFPTYYPQPGDDPATVLQKKKARERFGSGLRGASSRAFDRMYPDYEASAPTPAPQSDNGGVAKPTSPAERDALPPGTQYLAPDGSLRVKQ